MIKNQEKVIHLVQVCHTLSDSKTKKRELRSLIKAADELCGTNEIELILLTMDATKEVPYSIKPPIL